MSSHSPLNPPPSVDLRCVEAGAASPLGVCLTIAEVAQRAGVSPETVDEWIKHGLLPLVDLPSGKGKRRPAGPSRHGAPVRLSRGRKLYRIAESDWVRFVNAYKRRLG